TPENVLVGGPRPPFGLIGFVDDVPAAGPALFWLGETGRPAYSGPNHCLWRNATQTLRARSWNRTSPLCDGEGLPDARHCAMRAIIDWGMSGILNFAHEFGMKDAMLGSANLLFSWYELFKEKTADLVPRGETQEKIIAAPGVIGRCNAMVVPGNVGGRFRQKWFARERLEMSPDVRRGWVRQKDAGDVPPFTTADQDDIETEVLKELGDM
ncbi:hypothetical protein CPLU01_15664, partial [Colletotrichum plurivorum]